MHNLPGTVAILAYDGLCTFEFGIAVEIFGLARPEFDFPWYEHAIAAVDPGPMRATGGIQVLADGGMELLENARTIIIPGWRSRHEPVPPALLLALRQAHARGARLLSICSGVFVLAATGLLDGVTTNPSLMAKVGISGEEAVMQHYKTMCIEALHGWVEID